MAAPWGRGRTSRGAEAGQAFLAKAQGLGYWDGLESANVRFWPVDDLRPEAVTRRSDSTPRLALRINTGAVPKVRFLAPLFHARKPPEVNLRASTTSGSSLRQGSLR